MLFCDVVVVVVVVVVVRAAITRAIVVDTCCVVSLLRGYVGVDVVAMIGVGCCY